MQQTTSPPSDTSAERPRWDPRAHAFVRAHTLDGVVVDCCLSDLLAQADALKDVDGETPGEKVAVIELLLALCYASGTYPTSDEEWQQWVGSGHQLDQVVSWLAVQPNEDWDLFSLTRPLGQNALLGEFIEEHGTGPAQLVMEHSGDYSQFADHHHLAHPDPLPAAKAYRALLTQHVFGLSGRARVSGKKTLGPTITNLATGRLGGRIRVLALGRTLGHTLRLNLTPTTDDPQMLNLTWTQGPIERRGFTSKPPPRAVAGYADLHSSLGRSVLLRPRPGLSGDLAHVDRVLIGAGELLDLDQEKHLQDAVMSQSRTGVVKPLWPSATRDLWREAHALYAAVEKRSGGLYRRLAQLPPEDGASGQTFDLLAVGLLAAKSSAIGWVTSVSPFAPGRAPELYQASLRGSQVAEHLARSLDSAAFKAWEVMFPNPKPSDKKAQIIRFDARPEQWKATELPFRTLLADVAEGASVSDRMPEYTGWLVEMAQDFLDKRLDALPGNGQGRRARAAAQHGFRKFLTGPKAPPDLRDFTIGAA
ncbi:type I-E CRISPR-associated protein Cse1/CasA [Streptomyces violaceoruber]|uniref:type I-E CRISPR-associated protein Cse1/CasA n=1 Tax=Streptomyces violaceoruber TaxID=1935 RepID=UPI001F2B9817|nr:type I-E CRISPR-associated protein Cse1/CasA [Streptomyces violaceoruber]MCF3166813.1 type I-E CRISPR-associated protein Cse1/CasA [Streptomyces violaceoruber]